MTRDELIEQCRYYKGGENPFKGTGKEMECYWDLEKWWVERNEGSDVLEICPEWEEFYDFVKDIPAKYPGIPESLITLFFHNWLKWGGYILELDSFYEELNDYLWIPNDHYPEDQIPGRDSFIY